jgi:hypothetical protein
MVVLVLQDGLWGIAGTSSTGHMGCMRMIFGTEPRLETCVELVERDIFERRDLGNYLSPRLYPTAPFDPWQPVYTYLDLPADDVADTFARVLEA